MRYALISDIHGNLEALQEVLADIDKNNIDSYLCLGDIVGYGADPKECIRLVSSLKPEALIAGNHEWGLLKLLKLEYFNEYAIDAIKWTRGVLDEAEKDYLRSFLLSYNQKNFTLVHGSLEDPEKFNYIMGESDASATFRRMKTPVCFVGHSHAAGIFCESTGGVKEIKKSKAKIEAGKKYIVNTGSVGQPRDGDSRASYVIYDAPKGLVEIRRVEYDIKTAQKKILSAGLSNWLAVRLQEGR